MHSDNTNLTLWLAFLSMNEQATHDWLTGLYNRRYFEETLANHIEVGGRYDRKLSLILFDIDRLKQINDTQGHPAGDEALRQLAAILKKSARKSDIVCRYGGDEFAVLLPETGRSNAEKFIERVFLALEQCDAGITASAGTAGLPCEDLIGTADADLLARKNGFAR